MKKTIIKARCISPGVAEGEALVSKSRISFWGGADVMKGIFTERGHELENCSFKDSGVSVHERFFRNQRYAEMEQN